MLHKSLLYLADVLRLLRLHPLLLGLCILGLHPGVKVVIEVNPLV